MRASNDKELLKRTEKYILKDFLPPNRYISSDEKYEVEEYIQMLVLYNTEDSKYYIGKIGKPMSWSREEDAHKKLDPLNCPYIIRIAENMIPRFFT